MDKDDAIEELEVILAENKIITKDTSDKMIDELTEKCFKTLKPKKAILIYV